MAVSVVLDGPAHRIAPRVWRGVCVVVGIAFLVIAWIVLVPAFVLCFLLVIGWGVFQGELHVGDYTPVPVPTLLWSIAIGLVVFNAGIWLLRGKRRLVLFLRRFGHQEATQTISFAAARIGRSWRLVTLDDTQIAPVGTGPASRAFSGTAQVLASGRRTAVAAGKVAGKIFKFVTIASAWGAAGAAALMGVESKGDFADRFLAVVSLLDFAHPSPEPAAWMFRFFVLVLLVCGVAFCAWSVFSIGVTLVVLPLLSFFTLIHSAIGEAKWAERMTINDTCGIITARATLKRMSRRVFSTRLTVLEVDSNVWQLAVGAMAAVSAIPLIDVSEPTDNVLWEIEQLNLRFGERCVFVGAYDRVSRLNDQAAPGSVLATAQALLNGCEILAYTSDEEGVRRFVRALRDTLEHQVRRPLPAVPVADPITREMIRDAGRQVRKAVRRDLAQARRARARSGRR